jgi:hypothetical protein
MKELWWVGLSEEMSFQPRQELLAGELMQWCALNMVGGVDPGVIDRAKGCYDGNSGQRVSV